MGATHVILADADMPVKDAHDMEKEIQDIKGVKYPWDERKAVKEAEEEIKNEK